MEIGEEQKQVMLDGYILIRDNQVLLNLPGMRVPISMNRITMNELNYTNKFQYGDSVIDNVCV